MDPNSGSALEQVKTEMNEWEKTHEVLVQSVNGDLASELGSECAGIVESVVAKHLWHQLVPKEVPYHLITEEFLSGKPCL